MKIRITIVGIVCLGLIVTAFALQPSTGSAAGGATPAATPKKRETTKKPAVLSPQTTSTGFKPNSPESNGQTNRKGNRNHTGRANNSAGSTPANNGSMVDPPRSTGGTPTAVGGESRSVVGRGRPKGWLDETSLGTASLRRKHPRKKPVKPH